MTATNNSGNNGEKAPRPEAFEKGKASENSEKTSSTLRGDISNQDREDLQTSIKNQRKNREGRNTTGKRLFGHVEVNDREKGKNAEKNQDAGNLEKAAQGSKSDIPAPQPVAPHKVESVAPQAIPPEKLFKTGVELTTPGDIPLPQPVAPHKVEFTAPQPISPEQVQKQLSQTNSSESVTRANNEIPMPHPVAPHRPEIAAPQPIAPNKIESVIPQPVPPHKLEGQPLGSVESGKPIADQLPKPTPIKLDSTFNAEELNKKAIESLKAEQERMAESARQAHAMLPKVSAVNLSIPALPPEQLAERKSHPAALPVIQPAVLEKGSTRETALAVPTKPAEQLILTPQPIPLGGDAVSIKPINRSEQKAFEAPTAPAPIEIKKTENNGPQVVPIETHRQAPADKAPLPQRSKHAEISPVDIKPSVPMEAKAASPSVTEQQNILKGNISAREETEQAPPAVQKGKFLSGGVEMKEHKDREAVPEYKSQYSLSAAEQSAIFSASAEANQKSQAHRDSNAQRAGAERTEANHFLTGGGALDNQNFFQIPPGALRADVQVGHTVIINIYNQQTNKQVATAQGHIEGAIGSQRTLVIDNNPWTGKSYKLRRN